MLEDYTQHYPPKDRPDLLLAMAGKHWNRTDPSVKLPIPNEEWLSQFWWSKAQESAEQ